MRIRRCPRVLRRDGQKSIPSVRGLAVRRTWRAGIEINQNSTIAVLSCVHDQVLRDHRTEDIFNGRNSKDARKTCPRDLWRVAARKLEQLDSVGRLEEIRIPPGNRLEALSQDRQGEFSIRISEQYRVCFVWIDDGPDAVEIVDYH